MSPNALIIGQPDVRGVVVTVVLKCSCATGDPVTVSGVSGSQGACPSCKKVYTLRGLIINPDGSGGVNVQVGVPEVRGLS
jgi:hypothetical protein